LGLTIPWVFIDLMSSFLSFLFCVFICFLLLLFVN
jgi:hypothetical protein